MSLEPDPVIRLRFVEKRKVYDGLVLGREILGAWIRRPELFHGCTSLLL